MAVSVNSCNGKHTRPVITIWWFDMYHNSWKNNSLDDLETVCRFKIVRKLAYIEWLNPFVFRSGVTGASLNRNGIIPSVNESAGRRAMSGANRSTDNLRTECVYTVHYRRLGWYATNQLANSINRWLLQVGEQLTHILYSYEIVHEAHKKEKEV